MRIKCTCPCGLENQNYQDWVAHWKYGLKGKWRAVWLFLNTKISIVR
jgi:hypothetical protein